MEKYINLKYNLSVSNPSSLNRGRAGLHKIKQILEERGTYKNKTRDEVKEEITNLLLQYIGVGLINSRDELIETLKSMGIEIARLGNSYLTIKYGNERVRLRGGIYDEKRFREVAEAVRGEKPESSRDIQAELEATYGKLERYRRDRERTIRERFKGDNKQGSNRLQGRVFSQDIGIFEEVGREIRTSPRFVQLQSESISWDFPLDWLRIGGSDRLLVWEELEQSRGDISDLYDRRTGVFSYERWGDDLSNDKRDVDSSSKCCSIMHASRSYAEARRIRMIKEREKLQEIRALELQLIKELDPREVLTALGFNYKEMNGYLLLNSPVREGDDHPSFCIFWGDRRNCWVYYDHAIGWSGSCIDLWQRVRGIDYIEAVREIRNEFGIDFLEEGNPKGILNELKRKRDENFSKQTALRKKLSPSEEVKKSLRLKFKYARDKISVSLVNYLAERGIEHIPSWLREVHFEHVLTGKHYYGLGIQNVTGAWNVRNSYGKYVVLENLEQGQSYSLIKRGKSNKKIVVVEGLFDALTLEEIAKGDYYDIAVLNSVNNLNKFLNDRILEQYEAIILALDNDEEGHRAEERLFRELEQKNKEIKKLLFDGKDLNEALVQNGIKAFKVETIKEKKPEPELKPPRSFYSRPGSGWELSP